MSILFENKNASIKIFFVMLLFLVVSFIRIYDMMNKEQYHADEIFSIMLTENVKYYWGQIPDGEYTGEELNNLLLSGKTITEMNYCSEDYIADYRNDISHLWVNNGDTPHASLYYMLLRTAFLAGEFFRSDATINRDIRWYYTLGFWLNMLIFASSFVVFYKLTSVVFNGDLFLILLSLSIAFANTYSIENTLLMREYQLAEFSIVLLTFIVAKFLRIEKPTNAIISKYVILISIAIALTLSSGYLNAFYLLALALFVIIYAIKVKKIELLVAVFLSGVIGLLLSWLIYCGFFNFLIYDSVHTKRAFESIFQVADYLFVRDISNGILTIPVVALLMVSLVVLIISHNRRKICEINSYIWVPILAIISMVLVQYTAVLKMSRYIYPFVSIFILIVPCILRILGRGRWVKLLSILLILYFPTLSLIRPVKKNYGWEHISQQLADGAVICQLNSTEISQVIPCMNDNAKYYIMNNPSITAIPKEYSKVVMKKNNHNIEKGLISDQKALIGKSIVIATIKE